MELQGLQSRVPGMNVPGHGTWGLQSACLLHESNSIVVSKNHHFKAQYKESGRLKNIFYNFAC